MLTPSFGALPYIIGAPPWAIGFALQALLSLTLLWSAARTLRKPLPELALSDRRWTDPVRKWLARLVETSAASAADAREKAAARLAQRAGTVLLWELPLASFIHFANPVLQREVRGKFRWRSGSLWVTLFQAVLGLVVVSIWLNALYSAFDPPARQQAWWMITNLGLMATMLATAVAGAAAFTREREAGTWESLRLSLLPLHEVLAGKLLAPLVACFYYSLPILPILPLYVRFLPGGSNNALPFWSNGITPAQALASVLIVTCAAWSCAAWGLLISWLCRRTFVAVGWTLSTLLGIYVFAPAFLLNIGDWSDRPARMWLLRLYHPWFALAVLTDYGEQAHHLSSGLTTALVLFVAGCVALAILYVAMQRAAREESAAFMGKAFGRNAGVQNAGAQNTPAQDARREGE